MASKARRTSVETRNLAGPPSSVSSEQSSPMSSSPAGSELPPSKPPKRAKTKKRRAPQTRADQEGLGEIIPLPDIPESDAEADGPSPSLPEIKPRPDPEPLARASQPRASSVDAASSRSASVDLLAQPPKKPKASSKDVNHFFDRKRIDPQTGEIVQVWVRVVACPTSEARRDQNSFKVEYHRMSVERRETPLRVHPNDIIV
ncbi:hypothetical protein CONPUDRAFT_160565 [Coniophora puteana RWD-64-598 SS2]|uniref:Uncharacterized protein n=1 Tax=Coniophora puteana (strain RWD-64-598) TaxID=741705 RepID=R7SFR6_CONPW|nr:uncharacterized protein CONPUDRAFT_160565 [Coniophora puteana RWD-64-598 SS2]EIW73934.1 hypothetical protein CONPUDRAFT_160565 [Coniophora puteana RWD-64-598 SS2]